MSMPRFPDIPKDLNCENSISQILTSIAMEELALSHILNAEGEKLQYVLGTLDKSRPSGSPTIAQVLEVNESIQDTLRQVAYNQILLNAKMSDALKAYKKCKHTKSGDSTGGRDGPTYPPVEQ